jgi:hypothetical protein
MYHKENLITVLDLSYQNPISFIVFEIVVFIVIVAEWNSSQVYQPQINRFIAIPLPPPMA